MSKQKKDQHRDSNYLPLEEDKQTDNKKSDNKIKSQGVTPKNTSTTQNQGMMSAFKNSISQYIKKKIESKIMEFLRKQKPKVQDKIRDKNMPKCVQGFMDDIVEENWPILEEEVQYQLRIRTDVPFVEVKKPDVSRWCWVCWKFRSWQNIVELYHIKLNKVIKLIQNYLLLIIIFKKILIPLILLFFNILIFIL